MMSIPRAGVLLGAFLAAWLLLCFSAPVDAQFILTPSAAMVSAPAPRLEIQELLQDRFRFTIFMRTLIELQNRHSSRLDSYTAIAGIHGSPALYDNVNLGTDGENGYCQHGNAFFAPWHRPHLMLLEQVLNVRATQLAAQYTTADRAQYVAAARSLRLPYYDWGLPGGRVPPIFLQPTVNVVLHNGTVRRLRNPLNRYTVPADAVSKFRIEPTHRTIFRSWTGRAHTLENIVNLRSGLVSMFSTKTFRCFAYPDSTCNNTNSLENLHNELHGTIGGAGHMSYLSYAAFDPIFFLHHCNVDRHLAIWEGLNPTARMDSVANLRAYPFRRTATTWWTTRDVMNVYDTTRQGTRRFGYYYRDYPTTATTPAQLLARVNQLYNDFPGQQRTIITIPNAPNSPVDGTAEIKLVASTNGTTPPRTTASRRDGSRRGGSKSTGRRTVVEAGSVPVFTPAASSNKRRFQVKTLVVDITGKLAQIKAQNPGLTKVDIVATIKPFEESTPEAGDRVTLGKPTISTVVNGQVVSSPPPPAAGPPAPTPAPGAPGQPGPTLQRVDSKVVVNVTSVTAVVQP